MGAQRSRTVLVGGSVLGLALLASFTAAQMTGDRIPQTGGDITITPISHASLQIEFAGKVIQIDSVGQANYASAKPADLVLLTDTHPDHLDPAAIAKIRKPARRSWRRQRPRRRSRERP